MGDTRHHAIIVTSFDIKAITEAYINAVNIFEPKMVTDIIKSPVNIFYSIIVVPDGGKEGWHNSNRFDRKRADFIAWVESQADGEGGNSLTYCEVQYGDDFGDQRMINHN